MEERKPITSKELNTFPGHNSRKYIKLPGKSQIAG